MKLHEMIVGATAQLESMGEKVEEEDFDDEEVGDEGSDLRYVSLSQGIPCMYLLRR
jgi:hypothetical protein